MLGAQVGTMEGNESWYICCEKIVGLFRQAPQNLFKRFVHTFFFQQRVLLGGRLQMVRKLEPSWHHLSGSGHLVPWTLGVLNGIAAWLKWTEPLSPSGGDAYFVSAKGCDQQGDWGERFTQDKCLKIRQFMTRYLNPTSVGWGGTQLSEGVTLQ